MNDEQFGHSENGPSVVDKKQKEQVNRVLNLFKGRQAAIVQRLIRLEELVMTDYWSIPVMLEMVDVSDEVNKLFREEYEDRDDPGARMVSEAHDDFGHLFFEQFMRPLAKDPGSLKKTRQQIIAVLRALVSSIYMGDLAFSHIGGKPLHLKRGDVQ